MTDVAGDINKGPSLSTCLLQIGDPLSFTTGD